MEIDNCSINRDIVYVYLICKEMSLDFKAMKALYLGYGDIFWNFIYILFPGLKISSKKFCSFDKSAELILLKIGSEDSITLSETDEEYYRSINYFLKNKYENGGEFHSFSEVKDYLYFNEKESINVVFKDNRRWEKVARGIVENFVDSIKQIEVGKKTFILTSIYKYKLAKELEKDISSEQALKNVFSEIKTELDTRKTEEIEQLITKLDVTV